MNRAFLLSCRFQEVQAFIPRKGPPCASLLKTGHPPISVLVLGGRLRGVRAGEVAVTATCAPNEAMEAAIPRMIMGKSKRTEVSSVSFLTARKYGRTVQVLRLCATQPLANHGQLLRSRHDCHVDRF